MNRAQKILTVVFLILFTVSLIFFPWKHGNAYYMLSPFWIAPNDLGIYPQAWLYGTFSRSWIIVNFVWAWMLVMYVGLMLILAPTRK